MKRDRRFTEKMVLMGMITATAMAFGGCGVRENSGVHSLEDLKQEIELQGEKANAGSDAFPAVIGTNAPEETLDEEDVQEENVRDKMEQTQEMKLPPATIESGGESVPIQVLLDRSDIAKVQIINGSNGERITLTEGDYYEQILNYYEQLRIATEGERNQIVGYTYSLTFYDSQFRELQTMVPRSGKVVLDGMVYAEDGSDMCSQLEQYITEHYTDIWGSQQMCAYPLNVNEEEKRPMCIEIPYPPESLD